MTYPRTTEFETLRSQFWAQMTLAWYGSSLTLKRAIDARRIPLTLAKVGRQHVVATRDVAAYLIAAGLPGRSD